jgi:hypothetical protein
MSGHYFRGSGLVNETLDVYPTGRFRWEWSTDDGGLQVRKGTARLRNEVLTLTSEKGLAFKNARAFSDCHGVRWTDRLYLVSESEMLAFCNSVNLGLEPRDWSEGRYFLRMTLTNKVLRGIEEPKLEKAVGLPELPGKWNVYFLRNPIRGKVVELLDGGRGVVDLGASDGVKAGMELLAQDAHEPPGARDARRHYGIVTVVQVQDRRSTVVVKKPHYFRGLSVHQTVTSKIPRELLTEEPGVDFW